MILGHFLVWSVKIYTEYHSRVDNKQIVHYMTLKTIGICEVSLTNAFVDILDLDDEADYSEMPVDTFYSVIQQLIDQRRQTYDYADDYFDRVFTDYRPADVIYPDPRGIAILNPEVRERVARDITTLRQRHFLFHQIEEDIQGQLQHLLGEEDLEAFIHGLEDIIRYQQELLQSREELTQEYDLLVHQLSQIGEE